jgi:hypothetical protein
MHQMTVVSCHELPLRIFQWLMANNWIETAGYREYQLGWLLNEIRQSPDGYSQLDLEIVTELDEFLGRQLGIEHGTVILLKQA